MSTQRAEEPLPSGRLSVRHYRAVHHHLFQDVYAWAGKFRKVRIAKDGSMFCYPEHIAREMRKLFTRLRKRDYLRGLSEDDFAVEAARLLATLNAIHPFRDGNGRTQLAFLALTSHRAGRPLDLARLRPRKFLAAMIESFKGDEQPLTRELQNLIAPP
jgi:cell filamentation protein